MPHLPHSTVGFKPTENPAGSCSFVLESKGFGELELETLSGSPENLLLLGAKYEYYINVYLLLKTSTSLCRIPFVSGEDKKIILTEGSL